MKFFGFKDRKQQAEENLSQGEAFLAGYLRHGALGREVAPQDLYVSGILDRVVPGGDHPLPLRQID